MRLRYRYQFAHFYYPVIRFSLSFFFFSAPRPRFIAVVAQAEECNGFLRRYLCLCHREILLFHSKRILSPLFVHFPLCISVGCWNTAEKRTPSTEDALLELDFIHVKCILNLFSSERNAVTRKRGHIFGDAWKWSERQSRCWGKRKFNGNRSTRIENWWLKLHNCSFASHHTVFGFDCGPECAVCVRVAFHAPNKHDRNVRNFFV